MIVEWLHAWPLDLNIARNDIYGILNLSNLRRQDEPNSFTLAFCKHIIVSFAQVVQFKLHILDPHLRWQISWNPLLLFGTCGAQRYNFLDKSIWLLTSYDSYVIWRLCSVRSGIGKIEIWSWITLGNDTSRYHFINLFTVFSVPSLWYASDRLLFQRFVIILIFIKFDTLY